MQAAEPWIQNPGSMMQSQKKARSKPSPFSFALGRDVQRAADRLPLEADRDASEHALRRIHDRDLVEQPRLGGLVEQVAERHQYFPLGAGHPAQERQPLGETDVEALADEGPVGAARS